MGAYEKEILEALGRAIATEMEGYQFYVDSAALTYDAKGKEMFQTLAKDEIEHFKALKNYLDNIKQNSSTPGESKMEGGQGGIPILPPEESLKERLSRNPTEIEALKIGVDIESKAVQFYSQLIEKSEHPELKELLGKLCHMEKGHLAILQGELDSVSSSGFWCDHREFILEP